MSAAGAITLSSKASRRSPALMPAVGPSGSTVAALLTRMSTRPAASAADTAQAAVFLVGQVGGQDADPAGGHAAFAQQGAGLLQLRRGAREQDHPGAGVAKPERDRAPDAAPGPGDQCGLASEVSCHCGLLNG